MVKELTVKRTSKNVSLEEYWSEKNKNKKQNGSAPPPRYVNIDKRHHFTKPTEKLEKLDVNVAHYINEIKILPYSHEIDNIGRFFSLSIMFFRFIFL